MYVWMYGCTSEVFKKKEKNENENGLLRLGIPIDTKGSTCYREESSGPRDQVSGPSPAQSQVLASAGEINETDKHLMFRSIRGSAY